MIPHGRRLNDLSMGEYLSYVYGWFVQRMSQEQRARFDYDLTPDEAIMAEFGRFLPPALRGERPPADWALKMRQQANQPAAPERVTPSPRGDGPLPDLPRTASQPPPRQRPAQRRSTVRPS